MKRLVFIAALVIYLVVATGSSLTHRPQIDEGMFASPAYNLANHGHLGTTVLEKEKATLTRIDERTYWVMPLFLLSTSASFEAFGFSLFSMRLVSILFGLLLIIAAYFIALKISEDDIVALFAAVFIACDYMVLETASSARMDIMSAALGYAAIATYLSLRERNLLAAVVVSHTLLVIDGLTHPNAITAFAAVIFLTLYLDFHRLRLPMLFAAAIPYLLGGAGFAIWVMQDPAAFKDQFIDNAMMGGRMSGASSPVANILREFTERYPHAYGLGASSSGHSGPIYFKALMLIGYFAGVVGTLAIRDLRDNRMVRALLIITTIYFVTLAIIDGQKQTTYLIHIVPLYLTLLALVFGYFWRRHLFPRFVMVAAALAVIAVPLGGMALKIRQNTRGKYFDPMIEFVKASSSSGDIVMGGADLAFGMGFESNLLSDGRFGYFTGQRPRFIVTDSAVQNSWEGSRVSFPEFYEYFPRLLRDEYRVAFENAGYTVYEKR
ncbi:MAG: glycosyltransferase family 39 protein [Pyrinomonadaceae bacterium]